MTLSHPDDLWSMPWQLNRPSFLLVCLCLTHLEEPLVQANYRWHGRRNPVTQTHVTNEGGRTQKSRQHLDLKKANMHINTANSIRLQFSHTHTKNFACGYLFAAANEGMDLRTSWLIIYPASFMALINFPPLSLYLPLKVWSQPASGADNAGGLSSLADSPSNPPTHHLHWREGVAFIHATAG